MVHLIDTHYHLDFILENDIKYDVLQQLANERISLVAQTLTPSAFELLYEQFLYPKSLKKRIALGFHPWYISSLVQVAHELNLFDEAISKTDYIGEIGLDFVPKRLVTAPQLLQEKVFEHIIQGAIRQNRLLVLSIHAVKAEQRVLEIIEKFQVSSTPVVPVIHRFNGTSQQLTRWLRLGGYISVHPTMLQTKKGRAYIQQVPSNRLLLETDLPLESSSENVQGYSSDVSSTLKEVVEGIIAIKGESALPILLDTQRLLFGDAI